MKTIGSIVEKTSEKELQYSGLQRNTLKKQLQASQNNQSIKLSAQIKKNESERTADETGSFSRNNFKNKTMHSGKASPQAYSQANKMQMIDFKQLSNQIKNFTVRDNDEDFEEVEFPDIKPKKIKEINSQVNKQKKGTVCSTHR